MSATGRMNERKRRPMRCIRSALLLLVSLAILLPLSLSACGGSRLASGFDESAVKQAARETVEAMNAGQYEQISAERVREDLRQALSASVLQNAADQMLATAGPFQSFANEVVAGNRDPKTGEDYAVVVLVAEYERKRVTYTLSFNRERKLVGFFMR